MESMSTNAIHIVLMGDSDISRWPPSLYPTIPTADTILFSTAPANDANQQNLQNNHDKCQADLPRVPSSTIQNIGVGGAEMACLRNQLRQWREEKNDIQSTRHGQRDHLSNETIIFVACAGENDIGSGRSLDQILDTFRSFLDDLYCLFSPLAHSTTGNDNIDIKIKRNHANNYDGSTSSHKINHSNNNNFHLIFIGPKLEPWLSKDFSSRKQYAKLSNGLQRCMRKHSGHNSNSGRMTYVDCLTLFCTEDTANVPGAVHGGRAVPDPVYFDGDGLHLSEVGYAVWKEMIEKEILTLLM